MATAKRAKNKKKKCFSPAEANAMLPLLRSILRDITTLAHELHDRQERLQSAKDGNAAISAAHREELEQMESEFETGRNKMHELLTELDNLHIELKDPFAGLVDFRAEMDGREVYLCWRMDEPEVSHWHELNSGFASRKKLLVPAESH